MSDPLKQRIRALLEPGIEALGFELVEVEFVASRQGLLRLYLDAAGGITLDDCQQVSRYASGVLDIEDPLPGSYTLEVSSPGLDRPLSLPEHFERFAGHGVQVELKAPQDGRRRFRGTLRGMRSGCVALEMDGKTLDLPLDALKSARLVPELP